MKECLPNRKNLFQTVQSYIDQNYQKSSKNNSWDLDTFLKNKFGILSGGLTIDGIDHLPKTQSRKPVRSVLDSLLKLAEKPFSEVLIALIRHKGKKAADVYMKAGVTKQHFSKIKNKPDYQPSKETVLAFAIALCLTLAETQKLLDSAGFTLSKSSKRDLIVEYFIKEHIYDVDEINYNLSERGFSPLTNRRDMDHDA